MISSSLYWTHSHFLLLITTINWTISGLRLKIVLSTIQSTFYFINQQRSISILAPIFIDNHTLISHFFLISLSLSKYQISSIATMPISLGAFITPPQLQLNRNFQGLSIRCQSSQQKPASGGGHNELQIGSPIILVEAPPTLKTATSMPSLRVNTGEVKPGDVGRWGLWTPTVFVHVIVVV